MSDHEPPARTEDGRYVVVDGRRWRASDPAIPEPLRAELVRELMAARRALGTTGAGDEAAHRRRVDDAKRALGERGAPWWEAPTPTARRARIEATIRTLLRARAPTASICPSDVARVVGGASWRSLMGVVRSTAAPAQAAGQLRVTQRDAEVDVAGATGPVRIRRGPRFPDPS